ncbi:hypothetical protein LINPERPRIM_LOCUS30770 [Linum perenne]
MMLPFYISMIEMVPPVQVERRVSTHMNSLLTSPVTLAEIKEATFAIGAHYAPLPDGFPASFYHGFWDLIAPDVFPL